LKHGRNNLEENRSTRTATWRVGGLAKQAVVSVRTLHYYDEIGLLSPSFHTEAGHRLYGKADIKRLQQIKSLRQLGLSLEEIEEGLARADFWALRAVQLQVRRLREQIAAKQRLCVRFEMIATALAKVCRSLRDRLMAVGNLRGGLTTWHHSCQCLRRLSHLRMPTRAVARGRIWHAAR
jgi:DNA-binding transcriptional MerR regulator